MTLLIYVYCDCIDPNLNLQTIDVIIAWLVAEDDGAKENVERLLADRDETLKTVRVTLKGENAAISKSYEMTWD